MNNPMAGDIQKYSGHTPHVIGNFIDESQLNRQSLIIHKPSSIVFVFVGSLSIRKQPKALITALKDLRNRNVPAFIEYVGVGPESKKIEEDIKRYDLFEFVKLHGFLTNPESIIINSDVLVLPSLSEGVSRAAMEALFLGIPCVLRDVDGNRELVIDGVNGAIFSNDSELPDAMLRAAEISRFNKNRDCLLPSDFRQSFASNKYMKLLDV